MSFYSSARCLPHMGMSHWADQGCGRQYCSETQHRITPHARFIPQRCSIHFTGCLYHGETLWAIPTIPRASHCGASLAQTQDETFTTMCCHKREF
eukprot:3317153-Amphidinium_carterae.1